MAVLSSILVDHGGGLGNDGCFSHWAKYRVKCSTRKDTAMAVLFGAAMATPDPIPSFKASFSLNGDTDPNAFAQEFDPIRDSSNAAIWYVTVRWSKSDGDPDDDWTNDQDPTLRPIIVDGYEEEVQEICDVGWNEEALPGISRAADTFGPIVDATGTEPSTPIMRRRRLTGLVFQKNFKDLPGNDALKQILSLANAHVDTVCNATFYGGTTGKVICRSIEPSPIQMAGNVKFRTATMRVLHNAKGHSTPMVNCSFNERVAKSGGGYEIVQAKRSVAGGKPRLVTAPINLDLNGDALPMGSMGTVINWRTSAKTDFSLLGVGTG